MKEVAIDDAAAEQTVGTDVLTDTGMLMLAKGTVLSDSIVARLKKAGVQHIVIDDGPAPQSLGLQTELLDLLEERFSGCTDNPYFAEMKRIAAEHIRNP